MRRRSALSEPGPFVSFPLASLPLAPLPLGPLPLGPVPAWLCFPHCRYRVSVPLGVICVIFEARPDAAVQVSAVANPACPRLSVAPKYSHYRRSLCGSLAMNTKAEGRTIVPYY